MAIIDSIYEALTDQAAYDALPQRFAEAVGARSATLQVIEGGAPVHIAAAYYTPEMTDFYVNNGIARFDVWTTMAIAQAKTDRALSSDQLMTREAFRETAFFNEFFRSFGDDTGVSLGTVMVTQGGFVGLGLQRALSDRAYDAEEIAVVDAALPHLRRLVETRRRLSDQCAMTLTLGAGLDGLDQGVILTDADGRIRFANAFAERELSADDGLRLRNGWLTCRDGAAAARCDRLIREAAAGAGNHGGALAVPRPDGRSYRLMIAPNRTAAGSQGVLILFDDPTRPEPDHRAALRALYDMSVSEADLCQRLFRGQSLEQAAASRGVSLETVRSQLKSIKARTDTHRQADLMTLIAGLPRLRDDNKGEQRVSHG